MSGRTGRPPVNQIAAEAKEKIFEVIQEKLDGAPPEVAVAKACGVARASVYGWRQIPLEHITHIWHAFSIPFWRQRPDVISRHDLKKMLKAK